MLGDELGEFLQERGVTVMACCPTLLATIEQDLPELRLLLVGGEACPQNLVKRWYRPGRRILNSYGPTEATVTATLTELTPDKPVTIGIPLSTYSIVILDPHEDKTVAPGELGEIGIAGVGLALGYMNRDELTMKKFIRDFLNIQNNPSGRIYRTGDLGRIDENGEIDYRGRIDTQVKIRGYRIELSEIEAVLLDLPQIAQAAVTTFEPEAGVVEIVAYYALKQDADLPRDEISQALRAKLPAYMVPAFLEQLDSIPMTLIQQGRPQEPAEAAAPALLRAAARLRRRRRPRTSAIIHAALAEVLRVERVSTEHHFFDELGANSLVMARVCASDPQEPRTGERVDARHLHESDHRPACRIIWISPIEGRRDATRAVPRSVEARRTGPAARCRLRSTRPMRCSVFGCSTPAIAGRPLRQARSRSSRAASCLPPDRSSC